jgi:hypothetical protein
LVVVVLLFFALYFVTLKMNYHPHSLLFFYWLGLSYIPVLVLSSTTQDMPFPTSLFMIRRRTQKLSLHGRKEKSRVVFLAFHPNENVTLFIKQKIFEIEVRRVLQRLGS